MTLGQTVGIVQARMRSTRLPGKSMADIAGRPAIEHVLTRVRRARTIGEVWLACSQHPADDPLAQHAASLGFHVWRGDEDDVLGRYLDVAQKTQADSVVRITGDCPLIDPGLIDAAVARLRVGDVDYVSNALRRSYPDGLDVEAFTRAALNEAGRLATHPFLRAHVTPYIHGRLRDKLPCGEFRRADLVNAEDFSHLRWTLDEPADLAFLRALLPLLPADFGWLDVVSILTRHPHLLRVNHRHQLNEGTTRDLTRVVTSGNAPRSFKRSEALLDRALATVPLGSQTFSKSHLQFPRGVSPLFLERGSGCRVWDVDDNEFIDYVMGLMPIVLGYGDPDVDQAILKQLDRGIIFSLPSTLEMELAERLREIIPCAEMARFGKNGSDATTAAVRLARAYTGRDHIVSCGYHGWHDWYIGTTTRDLGVPPSVRALSHSLPFNDLGAFERFFTERGDSVACVIMEPTGKSPPQGGFLEGVRALTEKYGALLVFDEIITGFRIALGGAQAHYRVTPDLACFGKAMANGMPISAVVGRTAIMRRMEDIFFSATFGGEALSLVAALATIDKLRRDNIPARLSTLGSNLTHLANASSRRHGLGNCLRVDGEGWWPRLSITAPPIAPDLFVSLLRQELFARGLLLGASFNLCLAHDNSSVVNETSEKFDAALSAVREALNSRDPQSALRGDRVKPTFSVR